MKSIPYFTSAPYIRMQFHIKDIDLLYYFSNVLMRYTFQNILSTWQRNLLKKSSTVQHDTFSFQYLLFNLSVRDSSQTLNFCHSSTKCIHQVIKLSSRDSNKMHSFKNRQKEVVLPFCCRLDVKKVYLHLRQALREQNGRNSEWIFANWMFT